MPGITLSCHIDAQKLFQAFEQIPIVAARELRIEMKEALRTVQTDARLHHAFNSASHNLERSVSYEVEPSGLSGKVYLDQQIAPYAAAVHDGARAHRIEPKNKKALHWVSGGEEFFSSNGVNHPATAGDPFLEQAFIRQTPYIIARLRGAVRRIFEMVGL
jgi:hypothetical protein